MKRIAITLVLIVALFTSCTRIGQIEKVEALPVIFPDYIETTLPCNIAPITFTIKGNNVEKVAAAFLLNGNIIFTATGNSHDGLQIPLKRWHKLLSAAQGGQIEVITYSKEKGCNIWKEYLPFTINIAEEIDAYITYRLIKPGYELWDEMGIYQREISTYTERAIIENKKSDDDTGRGCVNCHSFCEYSPDTFMFHTRMVHGGTTIITGSEHKHMNLKTEKTGNGTYPKWHPSGKYIAFSLCETAQAFHAYDPNRISVYDNKSDLMIFNVEKNEVITDSRFVGSKNLETFPTWSPDGKWLYYSSAKPEKNIPVNNKKMLYGIYRVAFDESTGLLGDSIECIVNPDSTKKSQLFSRISPSGNYLLYTECNYGTFPIWHKESQLQMIDLRTMRPISTDAINSNDVESYHSWSSNGKWIIFSSRRDDGLYTRLYITHFDDEGHLTKPFPLPQKSASFEQARMRSYNIPEFCKGIIKVAKRSIESIQQGPVTNAKLSK